MSLRLFVRILAAFVALGVLALAAAAFIGVGIDAQRWREPIAAALSRALGREVQLEGPARLTLSLHPAIILGDIRIANPPGFDAPEFARIGEMRLVIRLLPLLRGEIQARDAYGRNVTVSLARSGDGRANWAFAPGAREAAPRGPFRFSRGDAYRLTLEGALIEYIAGDTARRVELAELALDERAEHSARLSLRGKVDDEFPYTVRAKSAPLSGLGAAQPWPFDFQVSVSDTVVTGSGTMSGPLERPTMRLSFSAGAARQRESTQPATGAQIVSGDLALDLSGQRPNLAGRLAIPELDLGSLFSGARGAGAGPVKTLAEAFDAVGQAELDLKPLALIDADVELNVARWAGVPGDVRDLSARLRIDAGRLAAPLAVTIAGALFEGDLAADGTTAPPRLRASLAAREAPLGGLAELLFDTPHVEGSARRFEVMLDAAGDRPGDLVHRLAGRIRIEGAHLTYGNYAGGRPVEMRLHTAEVSQPRGRTIAGSLRGSLRGKAFSGTLRAGTVEHILRERRTPFGFDGASGGVQARLSGTLAEPADTTGPVVAFDVTAPQARELTPWLGFSSQSDARVALKGTLQVRRRHASLTSGSLLVGRTSVAGDLNWRSVDAKTLVKVNLIAEVLAPAELRAVATPDATARRAMILEIPILPESLDFADTDLAVRVKRVHGLPLEITDAVFEGRMRGGEVAPSPFSLRVEGSALAGALALDARGDAPTAFLWVAGDDFDLGALLRRLRVARDIDSRIGTVRLYADIRERRLGDVLEQSSFVANIESGTLDIRDANTGAALRIAVAAGEVRADTGGPTTASITGTLGAAPVTLKAQAARLRELFEPGERLPFSITAETPAAKLAIAGSAAPRRDPNAALSVALTGERLSGLDDLLETSLPPWGPYALTARLRFPDRGYLIDAMRLAVGKSVLEGKGSLDTAHVPPNLAVSLAAERIQLDDFPMGDWSPFEERDGPAEPITVESARRAVAGTARRLHAILSRELLRMGDADVDVRVKRVVSGEDELGHGRFLATVANGRATIGPIEVETRTGSARGSLVYEPRERDVMVDARAEINRYDYGALARRVRPGSHLDGALSLDFRLVATAPRLSDALATGSGRLDFTVWPQRLQVRALDLWAANLLYRLLPIVDTSASPVNCAVGHFDLEHGKLRSRRLVIDTGNTRTEGAGRVDFATSAIGFRFVPRAKVPQFFSFATPIQVSGSFEDYRFSARPVDLLGAAARSAASPVVVPIQRLFGERLPGDGSDVCASPRR